MLITARGLARRFGREWALRGIDLDVASGESLLLIGGNGAGKTTLLRLLATAIQPTRGSLTLFGQAVEGALADIRSQLALVTHQGHAYRQLTAAENLDVLRHFAPQVTADETREVLARVGLTEAADRPVAGFSAGMRRRLGMARLLLQRPKLLLLDEPFGQLDVAGVALQEEVIAELKAGGATVVMSTHDHDRGRRLCDRTLFLERGQMATGEAS